MMEFYANLHGERYRVVSVGRGTPLLALHGFTGTGDTWGTLAKSLGADYEVIAPDLLGHGATSAPDDARRYRIESAAADLVALLDHLRIKRVHLLGYSMGGRLALTMAVKYPHYVESLILESASHGLRTEEERAARRASDDALAERIERDGLEAFVDEWERLPLWESQARTLDEDTKRKLRAERLSHSPQGLANSLRGMGTGVQPPMWDDLPRLTLPVSLIVGAEDAKFSAINQAMAERLPDVTLTAIDGAGHAAHLEKSTAFAEVVRGFLRSDLGKDQVTGAPWRAPTKKAGTGRDALLRVRESYIRIPDLSLEPITIDSVKLHPVTLPLKAPFRTSYGVQTHKTAIIVRVTTTLGVVGYGEASLEQFPGYAAETMVTGEHILRDFLLPMVIGQTYATPTDFPESVARVRGNHFAKAGLEAAVWDAFAKQNSLRLVNLLARFAGDARRDRVPVGVAVSLQDTLAETLDLIQRHVEEGYVRVKLKIKPGQDVDLIRAVRERFPDLPLMADANSAYTLADADRLRELDAFNLMMIEQPLAYHNLYDHSKLAGQIRTPICLDESVTSLHDWRLAHHLGAGKILNLKPGRVGGLTEALAIYNYSVTQGLDLWLGGMLETGIGRATALALAALPGFTLPGDLSASDRYFERDIIDTPFTLNPDGTLSVPQDHGIGVSFVG